MKIHEDIFMWNTICQVTTCSEEKKERIYEELSGKIWTIDTIEKLEREM